MHNINTKQYFNMSKAPSNFVVDVQHLSKSVVSPAGELIVLDDINFTIAAAEAVAIIGASGSGKSTLLGLLAGLDLPSSGKIFIDGVDIFALDEDGRASLRAAKIGFVFQAFQLLPNLTALENVMLPLELIGRKDARRKASEVLDRVGLAARLDHYPKQLSGGEQQRVAIARAFAPQPKLLFADEPTGNLDQNTGTRISDLLFELNSEQSSTLMLVTHDATLASRCRRQIELESGRMKAKS